jgi:hypothetical protein
MFTISICLDLLHKVCGNQVANSIVFQYIFWIHNFLRDASFGNRNIFIPVSDLAEQLGSDHFCCFAFGA